MKTKIFSKEEKGIWRKIYKELPIMVFIMDKDGNVAEMNDCAEKELGYPKDEIMGGSVLKVFHEDDREKVIRQFEKCLASEEGRKSKWRFRKVKKTGEVIWVGESVAKMEINGETFVVVVCNDITDVVEAEEDLRNGEERFRTFIESTPDLVFLKDEKGRYLFVNEALCDFFGKDKRDVVGKTDFDLMPSDAAEFCERTDREMIAKGDVSIAIEEVNGRIFETRKFPVPLKKGNLGVGCYVRDVTEAKRIQEDLRKSKESVQNILDFFPDAVFAIDKKRRVIAWNRKMEEITGKRKEEVLGGEDYSIYSPDKMKRMLVDYVLDGCGEGEQYSIFSREGRVLMAEALYKGRNLWGIASPLYDNGKMTGAIETIRDVTDLKAMESQLLQAQKMEAIGILAGGIAHDFNNLLSVIMGYTSLLQLRTEKSPELEQISMASVRAANLTASLLAFARKKDVEFKIVDINSVIRDMEKILRRLVTEDIEISINVSRENMIIKGDVSQITQVLMNLAANSRDAMPKGGKITIRTEEAYISSKFPNNAIVAGRYCIINFIDNGMGMDEETREKVFDPFFTTKEVDKGTGMGLSTVYGIVKQHNGHISVESSLGEGTEFKICLPLSGGEADEEKGIKVQGGNEVILLAEDDDGVREITAKFLRNAGYFVIEAKNGDDAISKFSDNGIVDIKLVICDVVMPIVNGKEVFETVTRVDPKIRFIFFSGYTRDILQSKGLGEEVDLLDKPIMANKLLAKVREVLDRK